MKSKGDAGLEQLRAWVSDYWLQYAHRGKRGGSQIKSCSGRSFQPPNTVTTTTTRGRELCSVVCSARQKKEETEVEKHKKTLCHYQQRWDNNKSITITTKSILVFTIPYVCAAQMNVLGWRQLVLLRNFTLTHARNYTKNSILPYIFQLDYNSYFKWIVSKLKALVKAVQN